MLKNVILTGCNGFIGRCVANALKENEYRVIGIDIAGDNESSAVDNFLRISLSDDDALAMLTEGIDSTAEYIIIHLAADIHVPGDLNTLHNNVDGVNTIVELTKCLKVKHIIYLSSIPVIGRPVELPITEEHLIKPDTYYHISKYAGELMLGALSSVDLPVTILRIPSPIGRGMRRNNFLGLILDRCEKNEKIELYGTGARVQNYLDVRDLVQAILLAIGRRYDGLLLIAGERSISNIQLANKCIEITQSKSEIVTGIHDDPDDGLRWEILIDKARSQIGFLPQYSIDESIKWIIGY